ncbi:MAG: YifB family Mg chelatase-like AAA ATPase [Lachnospiraceae bacterium]|nr:YifB family Mg chelatase-like AAA ATPase [Lachnospiraceae bacterium]
MATAVKSFSIAGIDGYPVYIEASLLNTESQSVNIIGMGDTAVKEAGERIQSALTDCGFYMPEKKIVLSLAPADRKKRGSHYDLALAVALLAQAGEINPRELEKYGFLGELSLGGNLRPCTGILPMILAAKEAGVKHMIVPAENYGEAKLVSEVKIYPFWNLRQVTDFLEGKIDVPKMPEQEKTGEKVGVKEPDFSEVRGQNSLIDAIVLAAAGGHNLLMIGNPGCGKTMIARRIPTILPTMSEEEALEVTKIHSISGLVPPGGGLLKERPFRAPHHNVSVNALIGGGANAMPGEISLSHNGVLFLDELGEFSVCALDALRQPLEDKKVVISRVNYTNTYPANFMFVAAMNPCPCGFYPGNKCRCSDYEIVKYRNKISGPILDRIDIQKQVMPVDLFEPEKSAPAPTSAELKARVESARRIQQKRFRNMPGISCNAQMTSAMIDDFCEIDGETKEFLRKASEKFGYSARVVHKLLRMSRTSADMAGAAKIRKEDVAFALHCRDLDKSNGRMMVV